MVEITLISEMSSDNNYIGITCDTIYQIQINNVNIGRVYLNEMLNGAYTEEWIEFSEEFKRKGLFRSVQKAVMKELKIDFLTLNANAELTPMYKHIGAVKTNYFYFEEMTEFRLDLSVL